MPSNLAPLCLSLAALGPIARVMMGRRATVAAQCTCSTRALRAKNRVTFVRRTVQKFIILLLADSGQVHAAHSLQCTLSPVHTVFSADSTLAELAAQTGHPNST